MMCSIDRAIEIIKQCHFLYGVPDAELIINRLEYHRNQADKGGKIMKLVPFVLEDKTMVAVNPERVDAIKTVGNKTRIFAGEFYVDVTESVYAVYGLLTNEKDDEHDPAVDGSLEDWTAGE